MRTIFKIIAGFLVFAISITARVSAQSSTNKKDAKAALIRNIIEAKNYVFTAQFVSPMGGMTRQLTSPYDVRVSPDTIVSYLPYFGRAYTAPIDPTQGGIQFTSTSFDYKAVNRNKGGWDINIATKDPTDNQHLFLTVFENGSATLQVTSNNKQPISFNGYVAEKKPNRKR